MKQTRRVLLAPTEIESSSEYKSKGEASTGSALSLYTSSLPTSSTLSSLPTLHQFSSNLLQHKLT